MQSSAQITVVKPDKHANIRTEVPTRDFWVEQRHALLMQLASIERLLGISNSRCRYCKTVREQLPEHR